jgi:hypothetical protein
MNPVADVVKPSNKIRNLPSISQQVEWYLSLPEGQRTKEGWEWVQAGKEDI